MLAALKEMDKRLDNLSNLCADFGIRKETFPLNGFLFNVTTQGGLVGYSNPVSVRVELEGNTYEWDHRCFNQWAYLVIPGSFEEAVKTKSKYLINSKIAVYPDYLMLTLNVRYVQAKDSGGGLTCNFAGIPFELRFDKTG